MAVDTFTSDLKHSTFPAEFFEDYPLFKKCVCRIPTYAAALEDQRWYPAIQMYCGSSSCKKVQTFRASHFQTDEIRMDRNKSVTTAELEANISKGIARTGNAPPHTDVTEHVLPNGFVMVVDYLCFGCCDGYHKFFFYVSEDAKYIQKIGQHPPFSSKQNDAISKALETINPEHLDLYQKGRRSEGHGYGIGAFAYYRRIVELVIAGLLYEIKEVIPDNADKEKFKQALANVKDSKSASARIEVVKDMLPASLRPGNKNPLGILHEALSIGIHSASDDTCLTWADAIRRVLVYLLDEVHNRRQNARAFDKSIDEIMQKVAKAGETKTDVK